MDQLKRQAAAQAIEFGAGWGLLADRVKQAAGLLGHGEHPAVPQRPAGTFGVGSVQTAVPSRQLVYKAGRSAARAQLMIRSLDEKPVLL